MTAADAADEHAIRTLVHRYADAASRRDPAGVAGTFTVEGVWQSPDLGEYKGRDSMLEFFTAMLNGWNAFLQGLMSGVVALDPADPDRATGRWFVQEIGQRSEGTYLNISGVYHDEYTRQGGAWLILRRRYDALLRSADGAVTAMPFPVDVPTIG